MKLSNDKIERAVILELQSGDSRRFYFLVEKYADRIYQFLFTRFKEKSEIEDAVQETFIKVYQKINTYNPQYEFSTWLYTIAYNEMRRILDKESFKKLALSDTNHPIYEERCHASIWEEIRFLPDVLFSALWLKYHEELELKEIAQILNCSVAKIKFHLFRARRLLRKYFKEQENENGRSVFFANTNSTNKANERTV